MSINGFKCLLNLQPPILYHIWGCKMAKNKQLRTHDISILTPEQQNEFKAYSNQLRLKTESSDTIEYNLDSVYDFMKFVKKPVKKVNVKDITDYSLFLHSAERNLKASSIRSILSRVRVFLKRSNNPVWGSIIMPTNVAPKVKIPITLDEQKKILEATSQISENKFIQQRAKTMVTLLFTLCPIRREEVSMLKWSGAYSIDWNSNPPRMYVERVKRGTPWWYDIDASLLEEIKKFITMRKVTSMHTGCVLSDYLFVQEDETPLSRDAVYRDFKKCVVLAGVRKEIATHYARHTLSTQAVDKGGEILELRDYMGDKHAISAEHYIQTSDGQGRISSIKDKLSK